MNLLRRVSNKPRYEIQSWACRSMCAQKLIFVCVCVESFAYLFLLPRKVKKSLILKSGNLLRKMQAYFAFN